MRLTEEFKNPPVRYRIKPFWFWNGDMTREEISRQIGEMADKGLGGMFICARQGMTVPYLSREWFELVQFACDEAKKAGLEAWLYDEYPYPSGMSGGEVLLEHPEAEHMVLHHRTLLSGAGRAGEVSPATGGGAFGAPRSGVRLEADLGWSRVLVARAYRVSRDGKTLWDQSVDLLDCVGNLQTQKIYQQTGLTKYNNKRFFSYGLRKILRASLPEGEWRVEIYTEAPLGDFKYYGGFFDPCNEEAVRTFIETTHERYRRAVGERFGVSVHGMFSDEVGLLSPIPWSKRLPEAFERRNGYSLLECLPALHDCTVKNAYKIRYDLYETAHQLFQDSYHRQVSDWCRQNRLAYATEVPSMRLGTQKFSDIIGGDTAHEKLGRSLEWIYDEYLRNYRSNARAVSSLARQLGREFAMIESFHSVGWTMTMEDAKWMIDRLGADGINLYNFHAFYYTISDITKHDAPPSQFLQNPYWKHYRKLADYVGRMGVVVSNTEADIHVAVLDPVAALWTRLGNPFQGFPYAGESGAERGELDRLRDAWVDVCKALLFGQVGYEHLDAEMLAGATVEQGRIRAGRASYSVVVVPPCHCMEAKARKKLEEFVRQGGCLIGMEELPHVGIDGGEDDLVTREAWRRLFQGKSAYFLERTQDRERLLDLCREFGGQSARVRIVSGDAKHVISSVRVGEDESLYVFVANQGREAVVAEVQADHGPWRAQALDLESGEIRPAGADFAGEGAFRVSLSGFESRWTRLVRDEAAPVATGEKPSARGELKVPMQGLWDITPDGKNICRFARVLISLDERQWRAVEVKTFIEQCDSAGLLGGEKLAFSGLFGTPKQIAPAYPITCWYRVQFWADQEMEDISILMDRETIAGEYEIRVNQRAVSPEAFHAVWVNDLSNRAADIHNLVRAGWNEIRIRVKVERDEDGLRDPLYLWGKFGVAGGPMAGEEVPAAHGAAPAAGGAVPAAGGAATAAGGAAPAASAGPCGCRRLTPQPGSASPDAPWCQGYPFYSGTMTYERSFSLEALTGGVSLGELPDTLDLSLGFSVPMHDCTEVLVNGHGLGVKAYAPYVWTCGRGCLREGENRVTVRITNTLANMLDGTYFDYDGHRLVTIEP